MKGRRDHDAPSWTAKLPSVTTRSRSWRRRERGTAVWCHCVHARTLILGIRNPVPIRIGDYNRRRCRDNTLLRSGIGAPIRAIFAGHAIRAVQASHFTTAVRLWRTMRVAHSLCRSRHQDRSRKCSCHDESQTTCHHMMPPLQSFSTSDAERSTSTSRTCPGSA